ncbi:Tn3 family transposase [Streptomyces adustus]|uniref:Tn3 family transposase n=1 Tax=Streptomyces adustus TaxID=1609272 RepID=UPI0035D565DF
MHRTPRSRQRHRGPAGPTPSPDGVGERRHEPAAQRPPRPRPRRRPAPPSSAYPHPTPALTRPIRWELISQQYDQMVEYATAIRTRTASTEAILRRLTRNASHPTHAAMLEVGRAQRTIFVARYLRLRDLQREIEEGLNVMESSIGANSVIAYGKGGEIASSRRDEQDMFVLCLRILQSALVHVNTLMLQDILGEPEWADLLTPADLRGLTPLSSRHLHHPAPGGDLFTPLCDPDQTVVGLGQAACAAGDPAMSATVRTVGLCTRPWCMRRQEPVGSFIGAGPGGGDEGAVRGSAGQWCAPHGTVGAAVRRRSGARRAVRRAARSGYWRCRRWRV